MDNLTALNCDNCRSHIGWVYEFDLNESRFYCTHRCGVDGEAKYLAERAAREARLLELNDRPGILLKSGVFECPPKPESSSGS